MPDAYIRERGGQWEAVAEHGCSHAVIGRYRHRRDAIAQAAWYAGTDETDIEERDQQ